MPIFEYVCKKCNHRFESIVLGRKLPKCPECASGKLERQVEMFVQGKPGKKRRGVNTADSVAHLRALVGNIPTIPKNHTKDLVPPRTLR
ncbi:MAG TPA: zinc ribbon domain-containing protein [Candidatus Angelobacter sp.]|jgi:putative FmdB family regulatory protein